LNKSELVASVAAQAGVDRRQTESVLDSFFETVKSESRGGGTVRWPGFGAFSTSQRNARTGRNPQTGAPVKIAASTAMKFSPSATLKTYLNSRGTKKAAAKKTTATKSPAARATAKKATATKSAPARKTAAKKTPAKATAARKAVKRS
jgi:DNA-binding protein HU-beta